MGIHDNIGDKSLSDSGQPKDRIRARAIISCPICGYRKSFLNRFRRKDIEMMVVALKVFDWMVCNKCGELLSLNLEFEI